MIIHMPRVYRVIGILLVGCGLFLFVFLLFVPNPSLLEVWQAGEERGLVVGGIVFCLFCVVMGGLFYLYGQLQFQLRDKALLVALGQTVWLTIEHERMTAVCYRNNWLQIRWQGRGAWLSYWLALPVALNK